MTTCCAYRAPNGEVWIGADSLWSGGEYAAPVRQSKIIRAGQWRLAFAANAVVPYMVGRHAAEVAQLPDPAQVMAWLRASYEQMIEPVKDAGDAVYYHQQCILASRNGVWELYSDGQVAEPAWGFVAIGSGSRHAYAAARAMSDPAGSENFAEWSPRLIVKRSIEIACEFDIHSAPPVVVERVE